MDRSNGVAFNFILAIFPLVIFLFTLIPYVTVYLPEVTNESIMQFMGELMPTNMPSCRASSRARRNASSPATGTISSIQPAVTASSVTV